MDLYKEVIADCIINNIHVCLKNNAPTGAVILAYCAIDAMAFLYMPEEKQKVEKSDFINWVENYLKTEVAQPYQYNGVDLYGARCGIVHTYSAESDLSKKNISKKIGYIKGFNHFYDPVKHPELVILGLDLFIQDFYDAVDKFIADIERDENLRRRVDHRLPNLFRIKPS